MIANSTFDLMSSYQPDCNAIEMFVGQIPRNMSEKDLRQLFENYGRIYKLNVLRDRLTGQSKGCCFLTYYTRQSALNAQHALHNLLILPGMHHAIQVKPADLENRNERKIFIGMISKSSDEEDIKQLFSSFGLIEECTILRDSNNRSRGCAFITYEKRQSAFEAIQSMHHSYTMDGCTSPINVRFADTPKDKEIRKIQQKLHEQFLQQITTNPSETNEYFTPWNLMLFNQIYSNTKQMKNNDLSGGDNNVNNPLPLSNVTTSKLPDQRLNQFFPLSSSLTAEWLNVKTIDQSLRHSSIQETSNLSYGTNQYNREHDLHINVCSTSTDVLNSNEINPRMWPNTTDDDLRLLDNFLSPIVHSIPSTNNHPLSTVHPPSPSSENIHKQQNNNSLSLKPTHDKKQVIGPLGCNLFIYHLPSEFTDHDLAQTFSPFGNILSAKIFIDKLANRSKCFGFVSYDNIFSAHRAIEQMNGFQIGLKHLKVQLKKTRIY